MEVYTWPKIREKYINACIILGNGSTIALSDGLPNHTQSPFLYKSLYEKASELDFMSDKLAKIFSDFSTTDFELILYKLHQAIQVNERLGIDSDTIKLSYADCQNSLIRTIAEIHPKRNQVNDVKLINAAKFLTNFRMIFTLNYDIILYWITEIATNPPEDHKKKFEKYFFMDCFCGGKQDTTGDCLFDHNWRARREKEIEKGKTVSVFFYIHGNITLAKLNNVNEVKITSPKGSHLDKILKCWENEHFNYKPLFIAEAKKEQKIELIQSSDYLSNVYWDALSDIQNTLVIYGWSMGKQDFHILERIKAINDKRKLPEQLERIAVSIHQSDEESQRRILGTLRNFFGQKIGIDFFYANQQCWCFD